MNPLLEIWASLRRREATRELVLGRERRIRVEELDRLALTATQQAQGIPPGTPVLLRADRGPTFLAALLGLWRAQLVPALAESSTPLSAAQRIAQDLGCSAIATVLQEWPRADGAGEWLSIRHLVGSPKAITRDGAILKLTSGSSGTPRAVLSTVEQLLADDAQLTSTMKLRREDRILASIPLGHSYGFASVALPPLTRGTRIVTPEHSHPFAPFEAARTHDVTFLPTTPAYLKALVAARKPPAPPDSLRLVIAAGAPLDAETATRFRSIYSRPVHTFYGSSETGGITFDREGGAAERGTVGSPVDGVKITLAATEPTSDSAAGHVVVQSPAVATTYYPQPDPALALGRFRTSDLGTWRGDELQLLGRSDRLLNIRGRKLDPARLEALLTSIEGVDDCAVVLIDLEETLGSRKRDPFLRAVIASRTVSESTLREFCSHRLPPHERPRSYVVVEALPRTSRGKIDYRTLSSPSFGHSR